MALVSGISAERMEAYMNENVTSGVINEVGNLILSTRGGGQIDAGSAIPVVPLASDIQAGRVELADDTEALAGTDTTKAITPANLAARIAALTGYRFQQTVRYTSSSIFTKGSFPEGKAVRVRVQGGGAAGGPAGTASAGNHSTAGGGGGGGYAEKFILFSALAATETVTVGAGGAGSTAASNGASGGTSSFGAHCVATGGSGGAFSNNVSLYVSAPGGDGGIGTAGDILVKGAGGGNGTGYSTLASAGHGGSGHFGGGAMAPTTGASTGLAGNAGGNYGGGGSGAMTNQNFATSSAGGSGAPGIVLVDVYI